MFRIYRSYLMVAPFKPNGVRWKRIDKSKLPVINESDLDERFIKGGGPGGQKVNKSSNCVSLIHAPSGLHVKVHESRYQFQNRKIARQKLQLKLDNLINGENSIENQTKQILENKSRKAEQKQRKRAEWKKKWKEILSEYDK